MPLTDFDANLLTINKKINVIFDILIIIVLKQ